MDMHYCDIFGDCYHCPAAFCPYEKLEPSWLDTPCPVDDGDDSEDADLQDCTLKLANLSPKKFFSPYSIQEIFWKQEFAIRDNSFIHIGAISAPNMK